MADNNVNYSIPGVVGAGPIRGPVELQNKWDELGTTGLSAYAGWITEAYEADLYWPTVSPLYDRIWRSDPETVIARTWFSALAAKQRLEFVTPAEVEHPTDDDKRAVDFGNQVLDDIEGGISQWLVSCVTRAPFYGWGLWEAVPGLRVDGWRPPNNDDWRSQYNDGLVGFRRLAFRYYSSFYSWKMDDQTGKVTGMKQYDSPNPLITLPIDRCLHVRYGDPDNPEGLATMEGIWRLERYKHGLEIVQGIGFEHTAGHVSVTTEKGTTITSDDIATIRKMARALLSAQESNYAAWPPGVVGAIVSTPFAAAQQLLDAIRYYGVLKLALYGMQWAALGTLSPYGSYSTIKDMSQFSLAVYNSSVDGMVQQADNQLGRRLFDYPVNKAAFPNMTRRPVLTVSPAQKVVDLPELGQFMTAMSAVMPLGKDDFIAIRKRSDVLPEALPDIEEEPTETPEETQPEQAAEDDAAEGMDSDGAPDVDAEEKPVTPQEAKEALGEFSEWAKSNRPGVYRALHRKAAK